jgi:RNA polymerase sigma factor (sigma-70 family)
MTDIQQDQMILDNLKYCKYFAFKYKTNTILFDDLVNEGVIGLLKARKKFDPSRNIKFCTYAIYWIKDAIQQYVQKNKMDYVEFEDYMVKTHVDYEQYVDDQHHLPVTYKHLDELSERSKDIVVSHNMQDITYTELRKKYKISSERVKQLETKAINEIKEQVLKRI